MATGINTHEKLSEDAIIAARPHLDPYPLPTDNAPVKIEYAGKLPEKTILQTITTDYCSISEKGKLNSGNIDLNSFVLSDNFFALHHLIQTGKKATLIYLDPPYGTGMEFQSRDLEHSYKDTMGYAAYIEFMRRRFILIRELLTEDGSLYVHIGHQMLAQLKAVLDEVFGIKNFRNIITRRKCSSKNFTKHQYSNIHDYILFYTKSSSYKWNQPGLTPDEEWINKEYTKADKKGRYKLVPVHAPGTRRGETGGLWKGMMPPPGKHWQYIPSKLDDFDAAGEIHWSKNGNPRRKVYLEKDKKVTMTDYWDMFRDAHHQSIMITGYPTEKNLDMLKLIVSASSDENDLVIDPFCGSGTTLQAALELNRNWIGIDQSFSAAKATIKRLRYGLKPMGDYVDVKKEVSPGLFDLNGMTAHAPCDFNFYADSWLAESYPDKLLELAKI